MRIYLCGVRGSTPAPGAEFVRYGGHTSCVALAHDGAAGPTLILDAGTGLRRVTTLLGGQPFSGTILLTHLHWDHVHGLPFFAAGDRDGSRAALLLPAQPDSTPAADVLARGMSPPHFPIGPHGLRGDWSFGTIEPGLLKAEGFTVRRWRSRTRAAAPSATGSATATPPSPTSPTIAPQHSARDRTAGASTTRPHSTSPPVRTC